MNEEDTNTVEMNIWDVLAVLTMFEHFRRRQPDDKSAWNDVKALIRAGVLVPAEFQDAAESLCNAEDDRRKYLERLLDDANFREKISGPALRGKE